MTYYTPSIAVIVAAYNRPKTLLRLLDLLNDQRCIDFRRMPVCVVEDGSDHSPFLKELPEQDTVYDFSDEQLSAEVGKYKFPFAYVYRPRHPDNVSRVYSSRNLAARITGIYGSDLILQLDDDVEFHPYLINLLQSLAGMATDEHWVWVPRISNNIDVEKGNTEFRRGVDGRWYDGKVTWHETHWQSTDSSAMLMSRKTWDAVGGYDEEFDACMGAADQELSLRVQKLGAEPGDVKVWIGPYFVNKADEETGSWRMEMINRRTRSERNEDILARKHPDAKEWTNL